MTSVSTVDGSATGKEKAVVTTDKPSNGQAETAADTPANSGLSNNTSPHSMSSRSHQGFSSGTWECRVQKQCDQLRDLFKLPDTEV